jgi:hypothetical protein
MKNIISLILLLVIIVCTLEADSVAIALKVKGDVELTREETLRQTQTGDEFINKDELESQENSFAAIKFVDGSSVVKLFPNSILTINAEKDNGKLNKKNYLQFGELWAKVTKKTGKFEIDTPTTVVSVKGTELFLAVGENGETDLFTFKGEVHMKNKADDNEATILEGQKAHTSGEGEILVSPTQEGDIEESKMEMMETGFNLLEIELENNDGEKKTIKINFE